HHHHHHASMESIEETVHSFPLPDEVKENVMKVYRLIAEAESHVHQMPVSEIHFHEVGMKDAIMDITAVCLLMHRIHAEQVIVSPINTGYGEVRCMHGIVPVPAPATEYLLRGIPTYSLEKFRGELCTPTGAALLKAFADSFGSRPIMTIDHTGYGMGEKDFEAANCVRVFLGEDETESRKEKIERLETNVDDMTGEEIGFAMERLFEAGASDVFFTPIFMKKNRPAYLLTVLCLPKDEEAILRCIFRYTSTLGVRYQLMDRAVLKRSQESVAAENGTIRKKISSGYGVSRSKLEYDDAAEIARKTGKTLWEVKEEAK
ncbi:MAG: nickel pincer cofactor biosynthesis protein LarC, partial [Bulleidia sp.]